MPLCRPVSLLPSILSPTIPRYFFSLFPALSPSSNAGRYGDKKTRNPLFFVFSCGAGKPQTFSSHHVLWQSRVLRRAAHSLWGRAFLYTNGWLLRHLVPRRYLAPPCLQTYYLSLTLQRGTTEHRSYCHNYDHDNNFRSITTQVIVINLRHHQHVAFLIHNHRGWLFNRCYLLPHTPPVLSDSNEGVHDILVCLELPMEH